MSRHLLSACVVLGATFLMTAATASAAPAYPVDREQRQPDGSSVTLRPWGDESAGGWAVPFPTIDPQTVLRSARALDRYGPDFTYSHYLVVKRLPVLVGLVGGAASSP